MDKHLPALVRVTTVVLSLAERVAAGDAEAAEQVQALAEVLGNPR